MKYDEPSKQLFFKQVVTQNLNVSAYKIHLKCSAAAEVTKSDMYPYRKGNK